MRAVRATKGEECASDLDRIVEDCDQQMTVSRQTFLPPDIWQIQPLRPPFPALDLAETAPAGATGPP